MSTTKNGFYQEMNGATIARPVKRRRSGCGAKDIKNARFVDPWDNLLYAILLQAAVDSKGDKYGVHCQSNAAKFLQSDTARDWWDYLKSRPTL